MMKIKRLLLINLILITLYYILPSVRTLDNINVAEVQIEETKVEEVQEEIVQVAKEPTITSRSLSELRTEDKTLEGYRITSYYPGDNCSTGTKTGSGKTTNDFSTMQVAGKTVYSYQGKIVVAGATQELLKSGYNVRGSQNPQNKHYFKYKDTGRIKIDGVWYGFIVLDSCGAAMWEGYYRLDIFVPNSNNVIDTKNVEIVYD